MLNNAYYELNPVLDNYSINVKNITVETLKPKKGVWWVDTDNGKYILKKVAVTKDKLLFLLSAITHLRANGVNIPSVHIAKDGNYFVEDGEKIYILMEAIIGKPPSYTIPCELAHIMQGMATFHQASKNFIPPPEAKMRNHLGTWEKNYAQQVADLEKYKELALHDAEKSFEQFYLQDCDFFIAEGKACLQALKEPAYTNWVSKVRQEVNLCHQDFASGNLGLVTGTLYVYDMDSITFDLPARDLRKIVNKVMKKRGQWDIDLTTQMFSSYQQINPLSGDELKVVFIDIRFPHLFHGIASKYFENREQEWPSQKYLGRLEEMIKVEKAKGVILEKQGDIINSVLLVCNS